jgi:hypothetical protein
MLGIRNIGSHSYELLRILRTPTDSYESYRVLKISTTTVYIQGTNVPLRTVSKSNEDVLILYATKHELTKGIIYLNEAECLHDKNMYMYPLFARLHL